MEKANSWEDISCLATQEIPPYILELEVGLTCSQGSTTGPFSEPLFFKIQNLLIHS
jgi:hypothetical protein